MMKMERDQVNFQGKIAKVDGTEPYSNKFENFICIKSLGFVE